jgi:hypothetical protein
MTQILKKPRTPRKDTNDPINIVENKIKKLKDIHQKGNYTRVYNRNLAILN